LPWRRIFLDDTVVSGMKPRAWITATALAVALVIAAWFLNARRVRHFAYWSSPLSQSDYDALASRPRWRARSLDVDPGVVLRGLERRPADAHAPWVLYFPGNSTEMLAGAQRFLDALIGDRDWGAAVWAYRGFDSSGGTPDPRVLAEDGWRAAVELTTAEHCGRDRVHLVGFSLGTSVAAAVATRAAGAPFASTTLLAPLTEIDVRPSGWWFGGHRYETLPYLASMPAPVLVVHGGADVVLPVADGRTIASSLGSRARYVEVPGVGHVELLGEARAIDAVREFIAQRVASGQ
jgi:pimeloyl-ACP methyl ester carboxylesterase